ncbi:MAG: DUF3618 domain-containing protein [Actinomycetota bacterium]|nr:DUF3618 domain-containing protein [Actinomycetota bacterium]
MSDTHQPRTDGPREQDAKTHQPTAAELEAQIAQTRDRLAATVDELVARTQPKALARRQGENARLAFLDATHTQDGGLRVERLVAVGAAVVALVVALGLLRRRRG